MSFRATATCSDFALARPGTRPTRSRQAAQVGDELARGARHRSSVPRRSAEQDRQQVQVDQRRGEGLGRGHADLRPGLHRDVAVGHAHRLRADGVDDAPQRGAFAARLLHRRQRVGRLARLADGQHHRVGVDDRIAVAELGGDIDLDRDARQAFDQQLARPCRRAPPCRRR